MSKMCNTNWDKHLRLYNEVTNLQRLIWQQEINRDQPWKGGDGVPTGPIHFEILRLRNHSIFRLYFRSHHTTCMTVSLALTQSGSPHYPKMQWDRRDLIKFICYGISIMTRCRSVVHRTIAPLIKCPFIVRVGRKKIYIYPSKIFMNQGHCE